MVKSLRDDPGGAEAEIVVATLGELDESALIAILTQPKNALVKQYQKLFEFEDVSLQFTRRLPFVSRWSERTTASPSSSSPPISTS